MSCVIATFYRFVYLSNYYDIQPVLKNFCVQEKIKGTIILAEQGINATVSGSSSAIDNLFSFLELDSRFKSIQYHKSYAREEPFMKMKVRLKKEVVCMGMTDFDCSVNGEYISPDDWDGFISDSKVYTIDTRNDYEVKFGKFKNSINPNTSYFREFPQWAKLWSIDKARDINIAMYCTGGIRCEKSTAFMKSLGFKNVYHLKGGILNYLRSTYNKNKLWLGECFTFDDRIAVNEHLLPSDNIKCIKCSRRVSNEDTKLISRGHIICCKCRSDAL
ncbi:rhodanese-related sulfurtransferase [Neoehrlichia mikurensis]|uniref:tRNA uridine(34) hydroxylase n=1 Tax=Neoehrlichia mikurensis TaxID=89586 RepID=A0A9Q9BYF6_9RICK|nr:rhodanese-related sulfurtransferase [Neoehrlichia mikurensis]QXK92132.1 rhodanese-related sulfurtransferase [Neoehrlichia mikurensis]QXK92589.1 rhodanese-related sulfurtransferase [Neoehrlichia mikurensis]QXK93826.1 rhodanese-related sulfurtransferase [Neoehrlichia mikurensis]UTO55179.1 rhodanese-related sulfurtransferase [Neoehrlichia mikurensis]UTO56099.1 rhodanese-related sulfurtransferase [Neoehrlichia mikurensis]